MQRRTFVAGIAAVMAAPFVGEAQPVSKVYRVGVLSEISVNPYEAAFRRSLRDRGWRLDETIRFEYRSADGRVERLPALAEELVAQSVDVIVVTGGIPGALAAKTATSVIPIVLMSISDPVRYGLVESIRRPGGNITGLSDMPGTEMSAKRLHLLREVAPSISRVATIYRTQQKSFTEFFSPLVTAAKQSRITLIPVPIDREEHVGGAFAAITRERADSLLVMPTPIIWASLGAITAFTARTRLPAIYAMLDAVPMGGLMAYGVDYAEMWYRGGEYVDRLLRGATASDLPIQQAAEVKLVINRKTAKALGLTLPPALLARADEVIE